MKRETYERQKAFAGEKVPSMHRRCLDHDYHGRQMYMVTIVTEGRRPLLGTVVGRCPLPELSAGRDAGSNLGACLGADPDAPRLEPSPLGLRVEREWWGIPAYYPQVEIVALQLMPDHLHGIIFVKERMERDLSRIIRGFKTGCNRAFRELFPSVPCVATQSQQTEQPASASARPRYDRRHGLLFASGFSDKILFRQGQLQCWLNYLHDNPRRLLLKREHPDLFRVQRGLTVGGQTFSAIGNRFLLDRPERVQVRCSRSLGEAEIAAETARFLSLARAGAVLVSPSISRGEKAVMRAAFDEGLPLIILQENGFTDLAKPGGSRFDACARGQLLLLAPWDHHNERLAISRSQCMALNDLARLVCEA